MWGNERKLGRWVRPKQLEKLELNLKVAKRILSKSKTSCPKISIFKTYVEAIPNGKAQKDYDFGNKVSLVVSSRSILIVCGDALHSALVGHTLAAAVDLVKHLTNVTPHQLMVDKGLMGHQYLGTSIVNLAGWIRKGLKRTFRIMLQRRSVLNQTDDYPKNVLF